MLRRLAEVPPGDHWLTPAERRWLTDRRSTKRVADWRLGRWTAKAAVTAWLERQGRAAPRALEVLAAADGAPGAFDDGAPLELVLSLSHSHGLAVAAVAAPETELGCDLERVEPRSHAFVTSYFTTAECSAVAAADIDRDLVANLIWSGKESAFKALRQGLRVDTRSLEVAVSPASGGDWGSLEITAAVDDDRLAGRWLRFGGFVLTVVSRPPVDDFVELG